MEARTVEEFVEDMVSDGRTFEEIRAVTRASCWVTKLAEVETYYKKITKPRKKRSKK